MEGETERETEQEQSINFFRSLRLLIDVGTEVLRDLLLNEIKQEDLEKEVQQKTTTLIMLKQQKVLTEPQYNLLQKKPPDPTEFDITLLVVLLRNMCQIKAPNPKWDFSILDPNDLSIGADLLRIKNIRNTRMHLPRTLMPKSTFTLLWTDLKDIILRIAREVGPESTDKATRNIENIEKACIDPFGEKEQQMLKTLQEWQTQCIDIVDERISSALKSFSHKSDAAFASVFDSVDAVRSIVESMKDQLTQIVQDFSSLSSESQSYSGAHHILTGSADVTEIKRELQKMQKELASIKQHCIQNWRVQTNQQQNPRPNQGVKNVGDLTDKEIDRIAGKIGFEWERLGLFLDFQMGQTDALKDIYRDKPFMRNVKMIRSWRDVVVRCGESPRTLLAAAFASLENNEMAQSLFPPEHVEKIKDKEARRETKTEISAIKFDRCGSDNVSRKSMAVGGEGGINVFDGNVTLGSLSIHRYSGSPAQPTLGFSSQPSHDTVQMGGLGSLNIYGGIVRTMDNEHVQIGQPSILYNRNMNVCRGEVVDCLDAGAGTSDSNLKKTTDNTLSKATVEKYTVIMNSVGALLDSDKLIGTVFRVGSKYVMTAWHCVQKIVDRLQNGVIDWAMLTHPEVRVIFDCPSIFQLQSVFSIQSAVYIQSDLDIAVLELSSGTNQLPPSLKLYVHEIRYMQVPHIDIIGYGHPRSTSLTLDPGCKIVLPSDKTLKSAEEWLHRNKEKLKSGLKSHVTPASVDWGFSGRDSECKIIFNCFLEHGASGAPMLTSSFCDPEVVGVVTNGLPLCFWDLTPTAQLTFPTEYKFEMGTRMSSIYQAMSRTGRTMDIFSKKD